MKGFKFSLYKLFSALTVVFVVAFDQLTKFLVVKYLDKSEPFYVIDGIFRFSYVENDGAAFGMLDDHRWIFMIISSVAIIALLVYLLGFAPKNILLNAGLSLVVGGGIGNMIDRVALGYVVDFIDFCAFPDLWMWVFNVADSCVCVGAAVIALYFILEIIKEGKAPRKAPCPCEAKEENTEAEEIKEEKNEENE